jgi:hypothetical protein
MWAIISVWLHVRISTACTGVSCVQMWRRNTVMLHRTGHHLNFSSWRSMYRLGDNIKVELRETRFQGLGWSHLSLDKVWYEHGKSIFKLIESGKFFSLARWITSLSLLFSLIHPN